MAGFDPKAYAEAGEAQGKGGGGFDPAAYVAQGEVAQPRKVSPQEAYADPGAGMSATLGALDWLPGGKQAAALLTALRARAAGGPGFGETYHQALNEYAREDAASKAHQSLAHMAGAVPAFVAGAYALPGGAAMQGGLYGLFGSGADDALAQGRPGEASLRALVGTGGGALLGKGAEAVAPYLAGKLGQGAEALGGKVRDLAGWLKVNSIHPTPTLGEAMEEIPGGVTAVGRELLQRGIGGLTKHGTAEQVDAAFADATKTANQLASAFDSRGGSVDLGPALRDAQAKAQALMDRPATKEAGAKLLGLVQDYMEKHGAGETAPATAEEALAAKRDLGDIGYGAKQEFKLNKNPVVGNYGNGVRQLERGVDDALDEALGPAFEQANLLVRRLGGARQAAERAAARTVGNHPVGLIPYLAGAVGAAGSHMSGEATPQALAYGLGALLAGKYGAQVGARALYSLVGGGLGLLGRGLQALPRSMAGSLVGDFAAGRAVPRAASLADLLQPRPVMADRDTLERQRALATLQGVP